MVATSGSKASFNDRSVRSLTSLQKTASTSRVLNLASVEAANRTNASHQDQPFFQSKSLNAALIIKHRLRSDEAYLFSSPGRSATKVIIPFSVTDLSLGAQSFFVEQNGWLEIMETVCTDKESMVHDIEVLQLLNVLPSLDPFLLREHLKRHGHTIAPCYFAITDADFNRMQSYVAEQVGKLIELAYKDGGESAIASTTRLVEALLSTHVDSRLDPLRMTLQLEGEEFSEGVFCWKGFLYYKWVLSNSAGNTKDVIEEIRKLALTGPRDFELTQYINGAKERLQVSISAQRREVLAALQVYDVAFKELTANGNPRSFRDFLLRAPDMFLTLGEKIGGLAHVESFWRYRFPKGSPMITTLDEAASIFQDFEASLSVRVAQ